MIKKPLSYYLCIYLQMHKRNKHKKAAAVKQQMQLLDASCFCKAYSATSFFISRMLAAGQNLAADRMLRQR